MMLQGTNRNDDIQGSTALQHCYGWLQHCFNIAILSCEKIVVSNCPVSMKGVYDTFYWGTLTTIVYN